MRLAILAICIATLAAASPAPPVANLNVTSSLYFSIASLRSLVNIMVSVLPGFIYVGKNITIGVHVDLGSFLNINIDAITGTAVDLANEVTSFNITDTGSKTITAGVQGWNTTLSLFYNVSALWGLIDMQGPMTILVDGAGVLLDISFGESDSGYLFTLSLGNSKLEYSHLIVSSGRGYWLMEYLINIFQFLVPYVADGLMGSAISSASSTLNDILQNTVPEGKIMEIFPHSGLIIKPLTSPSMDPEKETLVLKKASLQVVDLKTKEPYYSRPIASEPVFLENLGLQNQIMVSDNLLNSAIKAVAIDSPDLLRFNVSDDSVSRLMDELPEVGQVYGEHLTYLVKYGFTPDTRIVANKSIINLFGNVSASVYVKFDENHVQEMVTFYSDVSITMNLTIANYRLFVMIKDVAVRKSNYVVRDENLKFIETEEEMTKALHNTFVEESSCLNGRFLLPYDLKNIQEIGYASKYLKDASFRFDRLDNYFVLGFNAHDI